MPTLADGATLRDVAEIIHAATVLGPAAWGRQKMPEAHMSKDIEDRLKAQLVELFSILSDRQIPYVLVGGIAMLTYIEGRNTNDVDLVLSVDSLGAIPEVIVTDRNPNFANGKFGDLLVDFLFTSNPLFDLIRSQYVTMRRFLERDIRTATIEGLILLKLFALPALYQQGNGQKIGLYENDIYMLCERGRPDMESLFQVLRAYVNSGQLVELRAINVEIQRRIERVDRAKRRNNGKDASA